MSKKRENIFVPPQKPDTVRHQIAEVLREGPLTAKEISGEVGVSEKEVYAHLEHIQKSITSKGLKFSLLPAKCKKCGFVYKKRERLKKPGKCPVCRGESIKEPEFLIE